nr:hypothetical protein [Tanacetum cinerariifolium]
AKTRLKRKQSSKHTSKSKTEASKTKTIQLEKEIQSSSAKDKSPSHPSPPTLVVGEMHIEAQQVVGGLTSLGATSKDGACPQLSSDFITKAEPGLSAPKDYIPSQQEQQKAKAEAEVASLKARSSYLDINQLTNLLVTSLKPELSKLLASHNIASCLPTELKELPLKFIELSREIKELKQHVKDMEIELPGDLKEILTKLETFTSIISNLSSQIAKLKTIQWELPLEFLDLPSQATASPAEGEKNTKDAKTNLKDELVDLLGTNFEDDRTEEVISNLKVSDLYLAKWREVIQAYLDKSEKGWKTIYDLDFQDSPDDEEDTRSSYEYLNDLEEEYQERSFLAKSKRFFKKHKPELRPTKEFEAKYNNVKAKLALLSSSALAFKAASVKNKGFIVEAYEWDEEKVSLDDNEMVEVKVLMALAEENDAVSKKDARNGEWVKISMRNAKNLVFVKSLADDIKIFIPGVKRPWLSEAKGFILPNYDTDESSVYSTPLLPMKKLDGAEPTSGSKTIKSILRSRSAFKVEALKGVKINEPSLASAKGNKSSSASKVNSTPAGKIKSVKIKDDPPMAIKERSILEILNIPSKDVKLVVAQLIPQVITMIFVRIKSHLNGVRVNTAQLELLMHKVFVNAAA